MMEISRKDDFCQVWSGMEYVTEFTFRGKPDNAIQVADEIIVFDAKSPAKMIWVISSRM